MFSTSALKQERVDAMTAQYSGEGPENYVCPTVTKIQDFYGRQMDTPLQQWNYGDTQRNIACIDNSLVTDIKDSQRTFSRIQASPPYAIKQADGSYRQIGGGFYGTNIGNPFTDYLGAKRDFALTDHPIYQANTPARQGVSEDVAWMDNRAKQVQQKDTQVYFLRM